MGDKIIEIYDDKYKQEVIALILYIQNVEAKVNLSIEDQPDLLDIKRNYMDKGGCYWIALNKEEKLVGSKGIQIKNREVGVLKKFFVYKEYRGKKYGIAMELYNTLLDFARDKNISKIILDSPSIAQ